jgi:hypothetical protein
MSGVDIQAACAAIPSAPLGAVETGVLDVVKWKPWCTAMHALFNVAVELVRTQMKTKDKKCLAYKFENFKIISDMKTPDLPMCPGCLKRMVKLDKVDPTLRCNCPAEKKQRKGITVDGGVIYRCDTPALEITFDSDVAQTIADRADDQFAAALIDNIATFAPELRAENVVRFRAGVDGVVTFCVDSPETAKAVAQHARSLESKAASRATAFALAGEPTNTHAPGLYISKFEYGRIDIPITKIEEFSLCTDYSYSEEGHQIESAVPPDDVVITHDDVVITHRGSKHRNVDDTLRFLVNVYVLMNKAASMWSSQTDGARRAQFMEYANTFKDVAGTILSFNVETPDPALVTLKEIASQLVPDATTYVLPYELPTLKAPPPEIKDHWTHRGGTIARFSKTRFVRSDILDKKTAALLREMAHEPPLDELGITSEVPIVGGPRLHIKTIDHIKFRVTDLTPDNPDRWTPSGVGTSPIFAPPPQSVQRANTIPGHFPIAVFTEQPVVGGYVWAWTLTDKHKSSYEYPVAYHDGSREFGAFLPRSVNNALGISDRVLRNRTKEEREHGRVFLAAAFTDNALPVGHN